ncbi:MAG TPA: hypothetical protein V6C63_05450 [Allocoleopsis sp.]
MPKVERSLSPKNKLFDVEARITSKAIALGKWGAIALLWVR